MAEVKASNVIILVLLLGVVGALVAGFTGYLSLGWFNKANLNKMVDQGMGAAAGFTPAKSPQEAMDRFREAIEGRKYTYAAKYCTKDYAAMLDRAAAGASELGTSIDRIREYAKNKGLETDKMKFLFHRLDPFPKNLKSGPAPVAKADKFQGAYTLEPITFTTPADKMVQELTNLDQRMFQSVLANKLIFANPIEIVKEGEEYKLNIPTNPAWELEVGYFTDNWKTYHTALESFRGSMLNERFDTPAGFEQEVVNKLRGCKK